MAWIIFDILHTRASVQISPEIKQILDPVDPVFDASVIEKIKNVQKIEFDPAAAPQPSTTPQATSSALPSPPPQIASSSASPNPAITPSPTATPSAPPTSSPDPNIFVAP